MQVVQVIYYHWLMAFVHCNSLPFPKWVPSRTIELQLLIYLPAWPMSVSWADKSYSLSIISGGNQAEKALVDQIICPSALFTAFIAIWMLSFNCNMMSCHCLNIWILVIKILSLVCGISHCCPEMVSIPSIAFNVVDVMISCHTMLN